MTYDSWLRPATATSPYSDPNNGPNYTYTYSASSQLPLWVRQTGPNGTVQTDLDGLGRAVRVEKDGYYTDTVYGPCACSPLGKVQKVSRPYLIGTAAQYIAWTVYTYDGVRRTVSTVAPDGASTTTYLYSGNNTTVTDATGKWKTSTVNSLGQLVTVAEPDPANQPGGMLMTSYSYDWMGNLSNVTMPRSTGTQTRTFVYDDAGRLTSATNPETGTVTYTYNADNTLQKKHDARGMDTTYTYDSQKRVTSVNGTQMTYHYDTNPVDATRSQYAHGRLAAIQYGSNGPWEKSTVRKCCIARSSPIACWEESGRRNCSTRRRRWTHPAATACIPKQN